MFYNFFFSLWMVFVFFCFWVCIGLVVYKCFLYFGMYCLIEFDLDGKNCDVYFKKLLEENLKIVENYFSGDVGFYIKRIGFQMYGEMFVGIFFLRELLQIFFIVIVVLFVDFF